MTVDGLTLKSALSGFTCDKMARAWRNRSNITRWDWEDRAAKLGDRKLAPVLYAACGELCEQQFATVGWPDEHWEMLSIIIVGFLLMVTRGNKPEKALSRYEYELLHAPFRVGDG